MSRHQIPNVNFDGYSQIVAKNALESTQKTALFLFSSQEWPLMLFNGIPPSDRKI